MPEHEPSAAELIQAVIEYLAGTVRPALSGYAAFESLIAIRLLQIAGGDFELGPSVRAGEAERLRALLGREGKVTAFSVRREPLQSRLDFRDDRVTRDARRALAWRTVAELNLLHAETAQAAWPGLSEVPALLRPGFERAERQLGVDWDVSAGVPKRSLLNAYFTRAAVDGMTDPFFLEILINQSLLPFERPFVVAHEWGHLAGFADESPRWSRDGRCALT
jgi:hypothetical protein